jgi:hypothetical protein
MKTNLAEFHSIQTSQSFIQCFRLAAGAGRETKTRRGLLSVCVCVLSDHGWRAATVSNRRLRLTGPRYGVGHAPEYPICSDCMLTTRPEIFVRRYQSRNI